MQTRSQGDTGQSEASSIFRRVLVPVNFSQASHRAVFVALDLRRSHGSSICLFNAAHAGEADRFIGGLGASVSSEDLEGESEGALRRLVENIAPGNSEGLEYDANVSDNFVEAIATKVKEWEATLVVLSPEPHATLFRTPSEKLVKALDVPVLLLDEAESRG